MVCDFIVNVKQRDARGDVFPALTGLIASFL